MAEPLPVGLLTSDYTTTCLTAAVPGLYTTIPLSMPSHQLRAIAICRQFRHINRISEVKLRFNMIHRETI